MQGVTFRIELRIEVAASIVLSDDVFASGQAAVVNVGSVRVISRTASSDASVAQSRVRHVRWIQKHSTWLCSYEKLVTHTEP